MDIPQDLDHLLWSYGRQDEEEGSEVHPSSYRGRERLASQVTHEGTAPFIAELGMTLEKRGWLKSCIIISEDRVQVEVSVCQCRHSIIGYRETRASLGATFLQQQAYRYGDGHYEQVP